MLLFKLPPSEVFSVPVIMILMVGLYYLAKWIFPIRSKPKPRKYSATVEHLLSLDDDQKIK